MRRRGPASPDSGPALLVSEADARLREDAPLLSAVVPGMTPDAL